MALPYTREFKPNGDGTWFARIEELPGCMTEGNTIEHASQMLDDAMKLWIEVCLEDEYAVPEPKPEETYSTS